VKTDVSTGLFVAMF